MAGPSRLENHERGCEESSIDNKSLISNLLHSIMQATAYRLGRDRMKVTEACMLPFVADCMKSQ